MLNALLSGEAIGLQVEHGSCLHAHSGDQASRDGEYGRPYRLGCSRDGLADNTHEAYHVLTKWGRTLKQRMPYSKANPAPKLGRFIKGFHTTPSPTQAE